MKKKIGRQKSIKDGRNVSLYLDPLSIDRAKKMGNGNVSCGIRKSLDLVRNVRSSKIIDGIEALEKSYKEAYEILLASDPSTYPVEMLDMIQNHIVSLGEKRSIIESIVNIEQGN